MGKQGTFFLLTSLGAGHQGPPMCLGTWFWEQSVSPLLYGLTHAPHPPAHDTITCLWSLEASTPGVNRSAQSESAREPAASIRAGTWRVAQRCPLQATRESLGAVTGLAAGPRQHEVPSGATTWEMPAGSGTGAAVAPTGKVWGAPDSGS